MIMRKQYVFILACFVLFLLVLRHLILYFKVNDSLYYISNSTELQQSVHVHVQINDERRNDKSYFTLKTLKR